MKTSSRRHSSAFTLIELLAVITIIAILAGLVVAGMGYVNEKQAREKARVQIALISKALEEYKLDTGTYPPTLDLTAVTPRLGTTTSSILFDYLFWNSDRDAQGGAADTDQKIYLPELDPVNNKQGWTTNTPAASAATVIIDPWGNQYCYRTAFGTPPANGTAPENAATQNPDFDLWSMGKDGTSKVTANDLPTAKENRDDIRNF